MQLLVMLAIALFMLLVASVASMFIGMSDRSTMLVSQAVTQLLTFLVPVVVMAFIYYCGGVRDYFRLDFSGSKWIDAMAGTVVMLLLIPANDWLTEWNKTWQLGRLGEMLHAIQDVTEGVIENIMGTDTVAGLIGNLLVVALIPAVCEEVFFRAGIQNLLQKWIKNPHAAIWITALVFSLAHGEIFSFMPRFVMGATLGYLYVYGGSLLPNVLAHFVNNAIVVVLYWLVARGVLDIDPEAPLALDWVLTACCTLAAVAVMWVTFFVDRGKSKD